MAIAIKNGAKVLYQWERGVALTVTSPCDVLRVSREEEQRSVDLYPTWSGDTGTVLIPDRMLTESGYLRAARIDKGDGEERVIERVRIIIRAAQKPENGASSQREIRDWEELRIRMAALERAAREGKFNGDDGVTPHIGENGNWYLGETDTGVNAEGDDGVTPHIGNNGNWFIGESDTGVRAKNEDVSEYANDLYTSGVLMTDDMESFVMTGGTSDTGMPQVVTGPGVVYIKGVRRELKKGTRRYNVPETERTSVQLLRLDETTGEIGYAIWRDVTINGDIDNGGEIVDIDTGELLPRRSGGYYDVLLCLVTIPAGATEITQDMIRDLRGDDRYCGYVSSKIGGGSGGILEEKDPTVPAWAKQPQKPSYTAQEVGAQPAGDYAMRDELPENTSDLNNDSGFITRLVSDLANYYTKSQTFTRDEINQKISTIPKFAISVVSSLPTTNISETTVYLVKSGTGGDLYTEYIRVNGAWEILGSQRVDLTGYATETWVDIKLGDYLKADDIAEWAKQPSKPTYSKSEVGLGNVANERQYSANNPPPYPVKSVNGKTGVVQIGAADVGARPSSWTPTASEVGADASGTAESKVSIHNTSDTAHNDIRLLISGLTTRLNALADSDDTTLDQLSEIVAYIKANKSLIDSITTSKINVDDIIDNLTTNVSNKPLSAKMGVELKRMIDAIEIPTTLPASDVYDWAKQPTKPKYTASEIGAPTTEQFGVLSENVAKIPRIATVQIYGAKGDGSTDDTAAFRAALAEERVVFVPGGTYKLSGEIVIGNNCMLELSQDTVLEFTNTTGNCINIGMSSNLKGNHATINVPYWFEGNVLYSYTNDQTSADINAVPPWTKWDPQWKSGRYVTDINICKDDGSQGADRGFHYAVNPEDCRGTAVYLSADNTAGMSTFMWGVHYSNLRIAGAFSYGIRAVNYDNGWNHEMRIDAFIDACETGVSLEDCSNVYVSAAIQPRRAYSLNKVYAPYAKYGIKLTNSKNVDLSGSRVWDWENEDKPSTTENEKTTLWTNGGEYQHIAMYGNCTGAIVNDFQWNTKGDTRQRIYTDNDQNLETLTVLQEPIDRWFKVIGGNPYYTNGVDNIKLLRDDDLNKLITITAVKNYTDVLAQATDTDGVAIFNDIGYQIGKRFVSLGSGTDLTDSTYYMTTGFIAVSPGQTINAKDLSFDDTAKGYAGIVYYNENRERFGSQTAPLIVNPNSYWVQSYTRTEDGFSLQFPDNGTVKNLAYVRMVFPMTCVGQFPTMAVNEPAEPVYKRVLADEVAVKGENIVGIPGQVTPDWVATKKEVGGDTIVISEQTVTSGAWNNRQTDIEPGIAYDVYINDTRYSCVAFEEDGTIYLGNNADMTRNDYPFGIAWSGGTAASGMFFKDASLTYPLKLKVTSGAVFEYNKMPAEYLPDGVAMMTDIPEVSWDALPDKPVVEGAGEPFFTHTATFATDAAAKNGVQVTGASVTAILDTVYWLDVNGELLKCHWERVSFSSFLYDEDGNQWASYGLNGVYVCAPTAGTYTYTMYAPADTPMFDPQYLPPNLAKKSDIPTGGTGGTSIDVTAEVGQTIVVKEVDENGKPTKWESAEYPLTETEIIPQTTYTAVYDSSYGSYVHQLATDTKLEAGRKYKVLFDGVEYTCEAFAGKVSGMQIVGCGNTLFAGGTNTGEPFALANIVGVEGYIFLFGLDGNEHEISISVTRLDDSYVPEAALPYYFDVELQLSDNNYIESIVAEVDFATIKSMHEKGRILVGRVRNNINNGVVAYYNLCLQSFSQFAFTGPIMATDGNVLAVQLNDDGTTRWAMYFD